jgi:hypothetical protein
MITLSCRLVCRSIPGGARKNDPIPPPRACASGTAYTMRRPRIFAAVTSSERSTLRAIVVTGDATLVMRNGQFQVFLSCCDGFVLNLRFVFKDPQCGDIVLGELHATLRVISCGSLHRANYTREFQPSGWKGMPGCPTLAGSGVSTSRFTTIGSCPFRTTTASQISFGLALIS